MWFLLGSTVHTHAHTRTCKGTYIHRDADGRTGKDTDTARMHARTHEADAHMRAHEHKHARTCTQTHDGMNMNNINIDINNNPSEIN